IHGELYASNVLVDRTDDGLRVCPVDWEVAAAGPGLVDLAALTAGWNEPDREAIVSAYMEEDSTADADAFHRGLALCRLHLAVQWLGWSPDWRPPAEHAHDWLSEAAALAEELAG
ncbi:MAG: phosphotransferase, partial [Actinomycetota bacterium]